MCTDMSLLLEPQMRLSDRALGSGPAASDRRVRLYGAWLCRAGPGPDAFPSILQALGVPARHQMGWLTILVEIFVGLAVLLGALVPLASIPMAAVLLVAMITVHLPYGFSSLKLQAVTAAGAQFGPPGFETDLLYLACLAALVLGGSGPLSIDGLLPKRRKITCASMQAGAIYDAGWVRRANASEALGEAAESHAPGPDAAVACSKASFCISGGAR